MTNTTTSPYDQDTAEDTVTDRDRRAAMRKLLDIANAAKEAAGTKDRDFNAGYLSGRCTGIRDAISVLDDDDVARRILGRR